MLNWWCITWPVGFKSLIVTGLKAGPFGSRYSVVCIATRYSLGRSLFESPWRQEVFRPCPDRLLDPKNLLGNGHRGSFPGIKPLRVGVNHQPHLAPRIRLGISAIYLYIFSMSSSYIYIHIYIYIFIYLFIYLLCVCACARTAWMIVKNGRKEMLWIIHRCREAPKVSNCDGSWKLRNFRSETYEISGCWNLVV
jgi:hypothetical protein